jgi:hypothetical protein
MSPARLSDFPPRPIGGIMDDARPHPPPLRQPAPSHLVYCEDVHVGTIGERAGVPVDVDQWQWSCGFYPCLNPLAYRGPCWPTRSRRREGALWGWALKPSLAASGQRSSDKNPDAFGRRRRARTSEEHQLGQLPCREATADRARAQRISCKCRATPGSRRVRRPLWCLRVKGQRFPRPEGSSQAP